MADPEEGPGGGGGGGAPRPPLLLDQTEATRAFLENAPPPPLSQGLDDTSCYCTDTGLQLGDPAPLIAIGLSL